MTRNKTGYKRDPVTKSFVKGTAPGPGRPPGSISIIGRIKQKFEEDPQYFQEWVDKLLEDQSNRRAVMEQIDGKPHQTVSGKDGKDLFPSSVDQLTNEELEHILKERSAS